MSCCFFSGGIQISETFFWPWVSFIGLLCVLFFFSNTSHGYNVSPLNGSWRKKRVWLSSVVNINNVYSLTRVNKPARKRNKKLISLVMREWMKFCNTVVKNNHIMRPISSLLFRAVPQLKVHFTLTLSGITFYFESCVKQKHHIRLHSHLSLYHVEPKL